MFRKLLLIAAMMATTPLVAGNHGIDTENVRKHLQSLYPATTFTAVRPSPVDGLYEVVMGRNIAYTNELGTHFLFGHLFDMQQQKDITAELLETLNRIDTTNLPLDDAIKTVHGNGQRHLYLFSDPDCPYCRQLEQELKQLDNVTIHTFLYPIAELHPQAADKTRRIWCSDDRNAAWRALMDQGILPEADNSNCKNPIERNVKLAAMLGIEGTPALILEDGRLVQGYKTAPELENLIKGDKN